MDGRRRCLQRGIPGNDGSTHPDGFAVGVCNATIHLEGFPIHLVRPAGIISQTAHGLGDVETDGVGVESAGVDSLQRS